MWNLHYYIFKAKYPKYVIRIHLCFASNPSLSKSVFIINLTQFPNCIVIFFFEFEQISMIVLESLVLTLLTTEVVHCRSSRLVVFCKKCVLKNFAIFTGNHLCQDTSGGCLSHWMCSIKSCSRKVDVFYRAPSQVFSGKIYKILAATSDNWKCCFWCLRLF